MPNLSRSLVGALVALAVGLCNPAWAASPDAAQKQKALLYHHTWFNCQKACSTPFGRCIQRCHPTNQACKSHCGKELSKCNEACGPSPEQYFKDNKAKKK